jgi:hypothetical protein
VTFHPGATAVWDTFTGLVPVKVLDVFRKIDQHWLTLKIEITRDHGPYRKGEVLESSPLWVVPPAFIRKGTYCQYIMPGYRWAPKEEECQTTAIK